MKPILLTTDGTSRTPRQGFTFIEVLLAVATLGLMAAAIAGLYNAGVQSIEEKAGDLLTQSLLRSQMETLAATPLSTLTSDSGTVKTTVDGNDTTYTCTWTVTPADLDGDGTAEPGAVLLTVSLNGHTLSLILVDHEGRVKRL